MSFKDLSQIFFYVEELNSPAAKRPEKATWASGHRAVGQAISGGEAKRAGKSCVILYYQTGAGYKYRFPKIGSRKSLERDLGGKSLLKFLG